MKQGRTKDTLVLGFAMFAIFFGAGNLIFPPSIGINTGADVIPGILGMTLTGILFPMLAMYAVVNMGSDFVDLSRHINSWWHQMFRIIGLLIVLFGTIPRCGAVACETGMRGIFPDVPDWVNVAFLLVFFALAYFFASNRSKVIDMIGAYATPILLVALLIIVVMVFVMPIGSPTGGTVDNAFTYGCVALKWSFPNITAAYIIFMILLALLFQVGPTETCNRFTAGVARVLGPALAIGFANSIMVLLNKANILDTLVYYMGNALQGKSPMVTLLIIYAFVTALNFFVVSGSGKAAMMMPILSPLGKMLGINQQVMVLTYQLGDGLTNYLWPAGCVVACTLCGIDYGKWFRFAIKAIGTMMVAAYILIVIANAIGYGPF